MRLTEMFFWLLTSWIKKIGQPATAIAFFLIFTSSGFVIATECEVYAFATPSQVKVGESIQVWLLARFPKSYQMQISPYIPGTAYNGLILGLENEHSWEIAAINSEEKESKIVLTFRAFQPGIYCFPSQKIILQIEQKQEIMTTNPVFLAFTSPDGQPSLPGLSLEQDFPPIPENGFPWDIIFWMMAGLSGIFGMVGWLSLRRVVPVRSCVSCVSWEIEMSQSIVSSLERLDCRELAGFLLHTIRYYLHRRWHISALPKSLAELEPVVNPFLNEEQGQKMKDCINALERMHYGLELSAIELCNALSILLDFIEQTADCRRQEWPTALKNLKDKCGQYGEKHAL